MLKIKLSKKTKSMIYSVALGVAVGVPIACGATQSWTSAPQNARPMSQSVVAAEIEKNTATVECITAAVVTAPVCKFEPYEFIPLNAEFQQIIYTLCAEYEISYDLILAVIKTESEFQWVMGDDGQATGYMQIWAYWWQGTAEQYGLDINNHIDNVHLGIIILTDALRDNGGDLSKALKQYNSGNPNHVSDAYINKVYENLNWIRSMKSDG